MKYLLIQLCRHSKCLVIMGVVMNLCMAMMYLQDDGIGDRTVLCFLIKCTQMALKERIKYPNRYLWYGILVVQAQTHADVFVLITGAVGKHLGHFIPCFKGACNRSIPNAAINVVLSEVVVSLGSLNWEEPEQPSPSQALGTGCWTETASNAGFRAVGVRPGW